uniref:uncharacterized protein At5g39570-like n=1 Tax=Erigeron canadensis TaxID=72917 RepID=UPI001CB97A20|nr:uncharacterized protein At5g39570-like [Erigeron canadensis]
MSYYPKGHQYNPNDDEDVDDFDEHDPTPYGGGYDLALTYGRPLPPSEEICHPPCSSGSSGSYGSKPHGSGSGYGRRNDGQYPASGYGDETEHDGRYGGGGCGSEYGSGHPRRNETDEYGGAHKTFGHSDHTYRTHDNADDDNRRNMYGRQNNDDDDDNDRKPRYGRRNDDYDDNDGQRPRYGKRNDDDEDDDSRGYRRRPTHMGNPRIVSAEARTHRLERKPTGAPHSGKCKYPWPLGFKLVVDRIHNYSQLLNTGDDDDDDERRNRHHHRRHHNDDEY